MAENDSIRRRMSHGMTNSPEFRVWCHMIGRCHNHTDAAYDNYGGRGVTVCQRWRESFEAFFEDMGQRPSEKHTIDRIENDGNYELGNCRWATRKEQNRNSRKNVMVTFQGRTQCIAAWAEERGVNRRTLWYRLRQGWTIERALAEPVHN